MRLTIGVQRSGRIGEETLRYFRDIGLELESSGARLRSPARNFPIELVYLRDDDIPGYVSEGRLDLGIVGEDVVLEIGASVAIRERLGFGSCRLAIAVPRELSYRSIDDLAGLTFATAYPNLLHRFLDSRGIRAHIHEISGSVEIAPSMGLADAICDVVSSGSTLISNGLREVEVVRHSEAVLIANPELSAERADLAERFVFRGRAVRRARRMKYILLNAPNEVLDEICAILPGLKSPTIVPLAATGWSSLHSVVEEDDFWSAIERVKAAGAQGILVLPIEKVIE